jgi:hypothetical protein
VVPSPWMILPPNTAPGWIVIGLLRAGMAGIAAGVGTPGGIAKGATDVEVKMETGVAVRAWAAADSAIDESKRNPMRRLMAFTVS